jgi:hypothetical protein
MQQHPFIGSYWVAVSGQVFRVVSKSLLWTGSDDTLPVVTLEPYRPPGTSADADSYTCPLALFDTILKAAPDPLGLWPYTPCRMDVETLMGKHGVRGIVGHDEMARYGWRSVDERVLEIGVPTWAPISWAVGARARTFWKDVHSTDAPSFNTQKTKGGTGNHQKKVYPPQWFMFLDPWIRDYYEFMCRVVERTTGRSILSMTEDEILTAWSAVSRSDPELKAKQHKYKQQREADKARIAASVAAWGMPEEFTGGA